MMHRRKLHPECLQRRCGTGQTRRVDAGGDDIVCASRLLQLYPCRWRAVNREPGMREPPGLVGLADARGAGQRDPTLCQEVL